VAGLGYVPAGGTPEDLARLDVDEIAKWRKVIKAANISIQ